MKWFIMLFLALSAPACADDDDSPSGQNAANSAFAAAHDGAPPGGTSTSPN